MIRSGDDTREFNPFRHVFVDPRAPCTKCGRTSIQIVADHITGCPAEHDWGFDGQLSCGLGLIIICEGPPGGSQ